MDNGYESINIHLNEEFTQNENCHFSSHKFYITILILIIFIMTFNIVNKDKIKSELKEEMQDEFNNQVQKNFLTNLKKYIKNDAFNTKVGLCVIGKKENKYAKEFVDYYKSIGFNHIFIYDNNDKDDERFEEVLSEDISKNFVSIINFRSYRGKNEHPQFEAFIDCYEKNSKNYDWLAFYDFDEFLYLKNHKTIQGLTNEDKFKNCSNIKINWMTYSDNDLINYENKPVQERFTIQVPEYSANIHIKSLVRGNLPTNYWSNMKNPHTSDNDYICCLASGEKTDSRNYFNKPPNYDEAYIKHYNTKTLEEFIDKAKRGSATRVFVKDETFWRTKLGYFFSLNKKTKEKLDYIKKVLNLSFN
jgi:hypothetical protein